jgi:DNA-directed RNA polymerase specialized sigma24 family protein
MNRQEMFFAVGLLALLGVFKFATDQELQEEHDCLARFRLWSRIWTPQMAFDCPMPLSSKRMKAKRAQEREELNERIRQHEEVCKARFEDETQHFPMPKRNALRLIWIGSSTEKDAAEQFGVPYGALRVAWHRLRQRLPEL